MKGNLRWYVVGLVALATVINYIDRGALGILWPEIKAEFGFSNQDYANIMRLVKLFLVRFLTGLGRVLDLSCQLVSGPLQRRSMPLAQV